MRVKRWKGLVVRLWVVIVVVCGVARLRLFNFLWVAFWSRIWSLAFVNNSSAVCVITLYFYMHLTLDTITITKRVFISIYYTALRNLNADRVWSILSVFISQA